MQINLLVPVLISELLMPNLLRGNDAKIIFSSSGLHHGDINFDDPEFDKKFKGLRAYSQSKRAFILLTRLFADKLEKLDIGVYAQHPGLVRTHLGRSANWFARMIFFLIGKKPAKGAESLIYLIRNPIKFLTTGEYYVNSRVKVLADKTYDLENARKVFDMSYKYVEDFLVQKPSRIIK